MGEPYLCHHGIKGQRWGVRRYQYEDGTLTKAGVSRYAKSEYRNENKQLNKKEAKQYAENKFKQSSTSENIKAAQKYLKENVGIGATSEESIAINSRKTKIRNTVLVSTLSTAAVVGTVLAGKAYMDALKFNTVLGMFGG